MKHPKPPTVEQFVQSYAEKAGLNNIKKTKGKKRLFYLCGAVTNDPYAEIKFALAEDILKREGHGVINPLEECPRGMDWNDAIVYCLGILNKLGELYRAELQFLNKAELTLPALLLIDPEERKIESRGVKLEKGIALANGMPIIQMAQPEWAFVLENAIKESEAKE
jgi:hypothetical protein